MLHSLGNLLHDSDIVRQRNCILPSLETVRKRPVFCKLSHHQLIFPIDALSKETDKPWMPAKL
jgi:hypothetical protein